MARTAVLGNGTLTVGIDEHGYVHDFYFPYVGLENLNNARLHPHMIGVQIDQTFAWLHEDGWDTTVTLSDVSMVVNSKHTNKALGIQIDMESYVDVDYNAFIRHVNITNTSDQPQDVRVFFHQVFQISKDGRSDTAMYVPDGHYILDYKGQVSALIKAEFDNGEPFDQYAVGNYGIEGKEGTFKDAEDGELSMSAVEHASVDSVLRLRTQLKPKQSRIINYWVAMSNSQFAAKKTNDYLLAKHLVTRYDRQRAYWKEWLKPAQNSLAYLDKPYKHAVIISLFTIKAHMDRRGGIIASCDSSIYNYGRDYYSYVWPRDGAYAIWPFIKLGLYDEAKKFFVFCRDILHEDGYMMHKYQPDKAVGSTWHPLVHDRSNELAIQEDETALILIMLGEYFRYSGDVAFMREMYEHMVAPMARFLASYIDQQTGLPHASYDLWEEKFLTTAYSTAATYNALHTAADIAQKLGHNDEHDTWLHTALSLRNNSAVFYDPQRKYIRKGFLLQPDGSLAFDNTLDVSSLFGAVTFNYASSRQSIAETAAAIEQTLLNKSPAGGTPRYENDNYFRDKQQYNGNPWFVTTLWMAQYYAQLGDTEKTKYYINWALTHALPSGILSEQIDPETGQHTSVTPLVWSHAELINTILYSLQSE